MMALGFARYVLREPTLSDMEQRDLVRIIGRSLQQCLTGPLPAPLIRASAQRRRARRWATANSVSASLEANSSHV